MTVCHAPGSGCASCSRPKHERASGNVPLSRRRVTTAQTCGLIGHDGVAALSSSVTGVAGMASVAPSCVAAAVTATSVAAAPAVRAASAPSAAVPRAAAARTGPCACTTSGGTAAPGTCGRCSCKPKKAESGNERDEVGTHGNVSGHGRTGPRGRSARLRLTFKTLALRPMRGINN